MPLRHPCSCQTIPSNSLALTCKMKRKNWGIKLARVRWMDCIFQNDWVLGSCCFLKCLEKKVLSKQGTQIKYNPFHFKPESISFERPIFPSPSSHNWFGSLTFLLWNSKHFGHVFINFILDLISSFMLHLLFVMFEVSGGE